MAQTIFFSWQSDRPTNVCRNLIDSTLNEAVEHIVADTTIEKAPREDLSVDRDTRNVPGSPEIFATILKKIESAIIFVPDFTFIGVREDGRPIPNPNVLIEYGYALKRHGDTRIIAVMNTAFGEPKGNLPFNLEHRRFPIQYRLEEDASAETRSDVRSHLRKELAHAIKAVFQSDEFVAATRPSLAEPRRTVFDEVEAHIAEERFKAALNGLKYGTGLEMVHDNARKLFAAIESHCNQLRDRGLDDIEVGVKTWVERDIDNWVTVRARGFSMQVIWKQYLAGSGENALLVIVYMRGRLLLPNEQVKMHFDRSERLKTEDFAPHLSQESEIGWIKTSPKPKEPKFLSNAVLANGALTEFVKLFRGG